MSDHHRASKTVLFDTPSLPRSDDFAIAIDGDTVPVRTCSAASLARFTFEGSVSVVVTGPSFDHVAIRPLSRKISPTIDGDRLQFDLDRPAKLSIEFDGLENPLFVFADRPADRPDPDDPSIQYFGGDQVHDIGHVSLDNGETLFVEGGSVLRGVITAEDASDVAIRGRGVIDATGVMADHGVPDLMGDRAHLADLVNCRDVTIEGVTLLNLDDAEGWTLVPVACEDVTIRNLKIVGDSANDDGIDVVGSERVTIDNCFLRTKDDCVAVKALPRTTRAVGDQPVRTLRVTDTTAWNAEWGNAFEIGYETRAAEITDIVFEDCDIIHAEREGWSSGGTLTIHNGDRAHVHDITFRDIRVEDAQEKFLDFKVLDGRYTQDEEPGRISDVLVEDVHIVDGELPPSIIQGYESTDWEDTRVDDFTIKNLRVHGRLVDSFLDARLITELVRSVRFVTSATGE